MEAIDLIFDQIDKGSLKQGANERSANNAAVMGIAEYKKGRFKKVGVLVNDMIKQAKKGNI